MWGFDVSDTPEEDVLIWPDCWNSFILFEAMATQWRVGACGVTGLDYNALPTVAKMVGCNEEDLQNAFNDIRIMEGEALSLMREKD